MVTRGTHNKSRKSGKFAAGLGPQRTVAMYKIAPANGNGPVIHAPMTPFQLEQWKSGTMPNTIAQHIYCSFYNESSDEFEKITLSRAMKAYGLAGMPAIPDDD